MKEQERTIEEDAQIDILRDATPILDIVSALCKLPGYKTGFTEEKLEILITQQLERLEEKVTEQNTVLDDEIKHQEIRVSANTILVERKLRENSTSAWVAQQLAPDHTINITYKTNPSGTRFKMFTAQEHISDKNKSSSILRTIAIDFSEGDFDYSVTIETTQFHNKFSAKNESPGE